MSLAHKPPEHAESQGSAVVLSTVWAMTVGQHLMAWVLTGIGVFGAIDDGVALPVALGIGFVFLVWHTAGSVMAFRRPRLAVWWLLGLAVIWVGSVAVSGTFIWLAFLLWLLAGHLLPLRWGLAFSVGVLAVVIVTPLLHDGATTGAQVFGPLIGGVFAFGISRGYLQLLRDAAERERLVASLTQAQNEMAALQDELALAQWESGAMAERTRISRDIHDTIAQALSSIRLLAHAGAGRTADADAAHTLNQVETLAGESLADVRRIVAALVPTELDDALAAALRRMLDRTADETGVQGELRVDESLPMLPTPVEVALLRTAQSALANVRLHSGAQRVVISLINDGDGVRLDIIDDGVGFDPQDARSDSASSYGLRFMRSRLRELGGGLDMESAPGQGTAISAHVPVREQP